MVDHCSCQVLDLDGCSKTVQPPIVEVCGLAVCVLNDNGVACMSVLASRLLIHS